MFHSRKLNKKINKLHECCLRIVYSDNTSSFEELLENDNSVSVFQRNTHVLATELYKIVNGLSPEIMKEFFTFNENTTFDARNKTKCHSRAIKSVFFGSETLSHLTRKIWELVPVEIKNVESVACFKRAIEKFKPRSVLVTYAGCMFFRLVSFNLLYDTSQTCFIFFFVFFCFYHISFSFFRNIGQLTLIS